MDKMSAKFYVASARPQNVMYVFHQLDRFFARLFFNHKITLVDDIYAWDACESEKTCTFTENLVFIGTFLVRAEMSGDTFTMLRGFIHSLSEITESYIQAYVETDNGFHQEEYIADCDMIGWPYDTPNRYDITFDEDNDDDPNRDRDCYNDCFEPLFEASSPDKWPFYIVGMRESSACGTADERNFCLDFNYANTCNRSNAAFNTTSYK